MVFSSITFLFFFLPLTVAAYFVSPRAWRNAVLLVASLVFYAWGGGIHLLLLLGVVVVNYGMGRLAERGLRSGSDALRRTAVAGSAVVCLGVLAYFKYANFAVAQVTVLSGTDIEWTEIALPIGISFFTFQALSYTIDVSRGTAPALRRFRDLALYVSLFPQLIAGPIVRFHEISDELLERHERLRTSARGAIRFLWGLGKKVLVADAVAPLADAVFADPDSFPTTAVWIGVLAYTIQIYFDFSGYSDMAIGLGAIFGFHFPENFNRPYSAVSITDFWRRWHITLSNWFRDYLFIPLGGSRGSRSRTYLNLGIVFLTTGLWHGAAWTFVIWGMYHGMWLIIERATNSRRLDDQRHPVGRAASFLIVVFGWVIFRAESMTTVGELWKRMVIWHGGDALASFGLNLSSQGLAVLAVSLVVVLFPRDFTAGTRLEGADSRWAVAARTLVVALIYPLVLISIAGGTFSPFLYFQF